MQIIALEHETRLQSEAYRGEVCAALEDGAIITLEPSPFSPSPEECACLRDQNQTRNSSHKNIAYKPHLNAVTGVENGSSAERVQAILGAYSKDVLSYVSALFPWYVTKWKVDCASFRPVEEQGRNLSLSHRNDLMHVDAFPTLPTYGGRILIVFTNINDEKPRTWGVSIPFEDMVEKYAQAAGLSSLTGILPELRRKLASTGKVIGLKTPYRSAYDEFMLKFHHFLKANEEFQCTSETATLSFAPGASWMAFTDQVGHKVISGQYAIEQTCIVPLDVMLDPRKSPLATLERTAGRPLVSGNYRSEEISL